MIPFKLNTISAGLIRRELDWRRSRPVPRPKIKLYILCWSLHFYKTEDLTNELIRRQVRVDPPIHMGRYE